jgi:hypothetical protein
LYGHGLGGAIAIQLAAEFPKLITGVIVENFAVSMHRRKLNVDGVSTDSVRNSILDEVAATLEFNSEWYSTELILMIAYRSERHPVFLLIIEDDCMQDLCIDLVFKLEQSEINYTTIHLSRHGETDRRLALMNGLQNFVADLQSTDDYCLDDDVLP